MYKNSVLFLQGPLGPFFCELAATFAKAGYITHKINFNGGDRFYAGADCVTNFTDTPDKWPVFLQEYLQEHNISSVFLLGDCRYYHRTAKPVCEQFGVRFMVFEEGYLRPNTFTLEPHGVNALSKMDVSQEAIQKAERCSISVAKQIGSVMYRRSLYASLYYCAAFLCRLQFPHYQHHRAFNPLSEGFNWARGAIRKYLVRTNDQQVQEKLTRGEGQQFVLCPLQVHDDSQLIYHSPYGSVEDFITEVMLSFHESSSESMALCFKHHPMDRGYTHYGKLIKKLTMQLGLQGRVFYCHDIPLPELYYHASSVVTVNSTVGISSLLHQLPTKVMGKAMYDIEGLTHQGSLASFWQNPQSVNSDLFRQFHSLLFQQTQINGSFFKHWDTSCSNTLSFYENIVRTAGNVLPDSMSKGDFSPAFPESQVSMSEAA